MEFDNSWQNNVVRNNTIIGSDGHGIRLIGDCPPVTTTESAPTYHLDENSFGYAEERRAEEHEKHIKGTAAGIMHTAGIPAESAIAIADKAKGYADDLRHDIEALARDKDWELSPHRALKAGDACGDLVDKVVKEAGR